MLSSEFSTEMGSLLRSLEQKVRLDPEVRHGDEKDALDNIERAIITLVNLHIQLRASRD
jgi:hypothetical protein